MKPIKLFFLALLAIPTLLWLLFDPVFGEPYRFFGLRIALINYSGLIAIVAMSVAMILAARPRCLERPLGGLDKMYRLHKWLGITGLGFGILHWLWVEIPKWLVSWGWLVRPPRRPPGGQASDWLQWLQSQRKLAEWLGEWAFYAALILLGLALWKRFPYRTFFKTHRLLAIAYLALAFHSLILMRAVYWEGPVAPLLTLLMLAGTVAALLSLCRGIGRRQQVQGQIETLHYFPDSEVLSLSLRTQAHWPGHVAGQFAFLCFDPQEGPHPFSITSAWQHDGRLSFQIKALGDYTRTLADRLRVGDPVRIEGPYGCFDFQGRQSRQIWVAGGIGIAPFLARLEALARQPSSCPIDLIYATRSPDPALQALVRERAAAAGISLHVLVEAEDGQLDAERLTQLLPSWREADVWFCGPDAFGRQLSAGLVARGLAARDFHCELFEMR